MRIRRSIVRQGGCLALATATVVGIAGCGFEPSVIPVPGATTTGPSYRLHIQFANALNVPARATVVADGVRAGNLTGLTLVDPAGDRPGYVVADVDISAAVRLPTGTTAQLRQSTLLGDVYLALTTPRAATGPDLADGATITLAQTRPALQVEDTMSGIATFVGGGAVTRMQDIVDRLNAALPADPRATAHISEVVANDLTDMAAHLNRMHDIAAATRTDIDTIRDNAAAIGRLLSAEGARQVTDATASLTHLVGVFTAIGDLSHAVAWLAPLASSGNAAARALLPLALTDRPLDLSAPSNLNRLVALLRDRVLPFVEQGPKVNIATDPDQRIAVAIAILRMIGAVR
ncbi:MlaD family protein [Nocardia terpenica]|uniref:Mce/MlaD domain-containing protein n=1 Tax=Nocardia terpenica TaxID=455432 RepID=A0A164PT80_9NOCA|nr:MlaD family protein [Nocardia terpenica]KZM76033.1 hypothetical protein AWN90_17190 [Nocardia terpenica]NQE85584.1 MCE family protein [Nocardia terpenica]